MRMTHAERLECALQFEATDRIPYSVWKHYPGLDLNPDALAKAQTRDAINHDFDFVKVTGNGLFSVMPYGTECAVDSEGYPAVDQYGTLKIHAYGVREKADWGLLKVIDPTRGAYGNQLKATDHIIRRMREEERDYPVIATIYSPLTMAYKLAGKRLFEDMAESPQIIESALKVLRDSMIGFIKENIRIGVSGFFFATQMASEDHMTLESYRRFGQKYDLDFFEAIPKKCFFNVVHIHGAKAFLELLSHYPCQCLSWHDRWIGPSIDDMRMRTDKCLMGGLDEENVLGLVDDTAYLLKHIREGIRQGGDRGFILGPGCTASPKVDGKTYALIESALREKRD